MAADLLMKEDGFPMGFGWWFVWGVEPKIGGKPPEWMVYNGKPYEQMNDLGVPLFLETPFGYCPFDPCEKN